MDRYQVDISVVIPVYRSQEILGPLCDRLIPIMETVSSSFEVIFVEDCGGDEAWSVIERLSKKDSRVRGIKLNKNFGQHNALLCGIRDAIYPIIVTMDDDLQHPPEEIPKLIAALQDECDVVYGTPLKETHGIFRDFSSVLTKVVLQNMMGAQAARKVSAFRVFRTHLRDAFADYHSPVVSIDALLTWGADKISSVEVEHQERLDGSSGYDFFKLLNHAFNLMTSFSVLPLRIASLSGALFLVFGFVILAYILVVYFTNEPDQRVPGFVFLASMVAIFSGVQLFSLGIIGEYIARIHYKTMDQPAYVLKYRTGQSVQNTPKHLV